jgi:putative ABC transport system permease protein
MPGLPRYRWLLRLLPPSFREEYAAEIVRTWRDEARDAGPRRAGQVWRRALLDTLRTAPREYGVACAHNLGVAARSLRRTPAFFAAAVLTLALGIGATTAVFTLLNAVLLRPLPFAAPDRVGLVWAVPPDREPTWLSFPELEDLSRLSTQVTDVAGFTDVRMAQESAAGTEEVQGLAISHRLLPLLGIEPAIGRAFTREDDRPGAALAVLLADTFWRTRFGADPGVVGRTITLDGRGYRVAGVLPAAFALLPATSVLPDRVDVWVTLEPHLASRQRSVRFLHALARLRSGTTFAAADVELRARGAAANAAFPAAYPAGPWTFGLVSFEHHVLREARPALWLLFGLVGLVLIAAAVNVVHLLVARHEARRADVAVRTALGASAARLAGEQMAETTVIAVAAGLLGLAVASTAPTVLRAIDPGALPRLGDASVDRTVLLFAGGLAGACAVAAAVAASIARRWLGAPALIAPARTGRTRTAARLGHALVVAQTAAATTVLVTALYLSSALDRLQHVDLGVRAEGLVTGRVSLSSEYAPGAPATAVFERSAATLAARPGVAGAAAISQLPLSGSLLGSTVFAGPQPDAARVDVDLRAVTTTYFDVAGMSPVAGRGFTDADTAENPKVAIVDETLARRLAPVGSAIGRRIRWIRQPDVEIEIVGVTRAVRHRGPVEVPRPTLYRPLRQYPRTSMFLVARPLAGQAISRADFRAALDAVDPGQPLADVMTMPARRDRALARSRTSAALAGTLAAIAVTLAAVGLHGVLAVGVQRRMRELGVRLAIGASPGSLRPLVLGQGLTLVGAGMLAGTIGGVALTRIAASLLPTAGARLDAAVAGGVAGILASAAVALWLPARRAARLDPRAALQAD